MTYNKDEIILEWHKDSGCYGRNFSDALLEDIILDEAKQDIQNFIDKFGEDTYNLFKKSAQRLKNSGRSTDLIYYVKNVSKKELDAILSQLERKLSPGVVNNTDGIRGKYKYLGEKKGFKVYQPFDAQASMDLGYMTGWCTTGRYGHAGESDYKPSLEHAKQHFGQYTSQGVKFYYFLNNKMEGQYAIAVYPNSVEIDVDEPIVFGNNRYLIKANFEIYDQEDELDYTALKKLPLDLLPDEAGLSYKTVEAITELVLPDGIKCVDGASIRSKTKSPATVERIVIPDSVTRIDKYAFTECSGLKSITIPDSVKSIGYAAFAYCHSLKSLVIPDSVEVIDGSAFYDCASLTSVTSSNSVKSIGSSAFSRCRSLTSITLGNSVTSIGDYAFSCCRSLTSITLPDGVTSIGDWVFTSCDRLTSITIPDSVTSIGSYAFGGGSSLTVKTNNKYVQDYCAKQRIRCEKLSR